jgi:hypothetical protein
MLRIVVGVIALTCLLAAPAEARHRHVYHRGLSARVVSSGFAMHTASRHSNRARAVAAVGGAEAGGIAGGHRVCASGGHCASVVASAVEAFQGLIRDFEKMGYAIGSPGCMSGGHMHNSKHHWGGACDLFNQVARNRTALRQPPPSVQIATAQRHGLTSGCAWRSPDCGHFEVAGRSVYRLASSGHMQ